MVFGILHHRHSIELKMSGCAPFSDDGVYGEDRLYLDAIKGVVCRFLKINQCKRVGNLHICQRIPIGMMARKKFPIFVGSDGVSGKEQATNLCLYDAGYTCFPLSIYV